MIIDPEKLERRIRFWRWWAIATTALWVLTILFFMLPNPVNDAAPTSRTASASASAPMNPSAK